MKMGDGICGAIFKAAGVAQLQTAFYLARQWNGHTILRILVLRYSIWYNASKFDVYVIIKVGCRYTVLYN